MRDYKVSDVDLEDKILELEYPWSKNQTKNRFIDKVPKNYNAESMNKIIHALNVLTGQKFTVGDLLSTTYDSEVKEGEKN